MAVSIRLRRMGRKKQPHYRIVVAESEHPRDGRFVESIGFYKPLSQPARLVVDLARVDHWIGLGAQPSDTVRTLIKKARRGGDESVAVGEVDVQVVRAKRSELLAERRTAEKKKAAAESAAAAKPTVVPQDVAETPEGSSAQDATAAEAMATGDGSEAPAPKARSGKKKAKAAEGEAGEG